MRRGRSIKPSSKAQGVTEDGRVDEVGRKLEGVRAWLERTESSGVLLRSQANFAWVTGGGRSQVSIGGEAGVASILVTPEAAALITTNIELARLLEEEVLGLSFETHPHPWQEQDGSSKLLGDLVDPSRCAADLPMEGLSLVDDDFLELRRVLHPAEIARYRDLGRDAATCVAAACAAAEAGETEHEIAARVAFECEMRDILALVNLVAADERISKYRHPLPTSNRLQRALLVALTGRRHGLHASLTRMVSLHLPEDDIVVRHRAVTRVDARAILESVPGTSLGDVLAREIDQYRSEGFPEQWRLHHQGGLTGYSGREAFAVPDSPYRLKANQALAWNPSITSVKSEDTILISDDGFEILTRDPEWPEETVQLPQGGIPRPSLLVKGDR
jgi:Xaa-Pro aminopeptidase